ncbi:cupin domain-containing protein [Nonomuraea terrae]|uniref:Cupin domain-containing protein n=1 Tax=Nonomuraea terrae TaxID=2530383 RepID=A0A4R4Z7Z1_9ACTN|nr:cupin domain-containing protein [Nonomuraea terrae]TDD53274.1 cupin domain-containing protein [Nonomuraea terrae]
MSYPPPRYKGDTGQVSAVFRPSTQAADLSYGGRNIHYLATGGSTEGAFGLYRWDFGPDESGPGPHFHRALSESFFVLDGTVRLYDGERWREGRAGDFLHVPPGGVHGFRNVAGAPASMLLLFTPGAPREEYFETLAELAAGKVLGEQEAAEFFLRHDNYEV